VGGRGGGPLGSRHGGGALKLARWTGSEWVPFGRSLSFAGISPIAAAARAPDAVLDRDGNPVVVWSQATALGNDEIYLLRWTGKAWKELGGSASAGEWGGGLSDTNADSRGPQVVLDARGRLVVAWAEGDPTCRFQLRRWTWLGWEEIPSPDDYACRSFDIGPGSGDPYLAALAASDAGRLVLAWEAETHSSTEVQFRSWDGTAWTALPAPRASAHDEIPFDVPNVAIAFVGDRLAAAWEARTVGGSTGGSSATSRISTFSR